jgi:hypothetical protein
MLGRILSGSPRECKRGWGGEGHRADSSHHPNHYHLRLLSVVAPVAPCSGVAAFLPRPAIRT